MGMVLGFIIVVVGLVALFWVVYIGYSIAQKKLEELAEKSKKY